MKITFFSNFLNHHQLRLCLEFIKLSNNNFMFVATTPVDSQRKELGYADMNKEYDFVLCAYENNNNLKIAHSLSMDSDIVILGAAPHAFVKKRVMSNKITFYYTERIFKPSFPIHKYNPRMIHFMFVSFLRFKKKNYYLLCAGAYVPNDFLIYNAFKGKQYKWGYFPNVNANSADIISERNKGTTIRLLWVGRFLLWKHPQDALILVKRLIDSGYNVHLTMIGNGELLEETKNEALELEIDDFVSFHGALPYTEIEKHMLLSDIFLFLSDYEEGWGAVLNEAMGCGCAVIASNAAGATNYLIKHNFNGFIYENGNMGELCSYAKKLIDCSKLRLKLGEEAFNTIHNEWNAEVAAKRILKLYNAIIDNNLIYFESGPCSKAD